MYVAFKFARAHKVFTSLHWGEEGKIKINNYIQENLHYNFKEWR